MERLAGVFQDFQIEVPKSIDEAHVKLSEQILYFDQLVHQMRRDMNHARIDSKNILKVGRILQNIEGYHRRLKEQTEYLIKTVERLQAMESAARSCLADIRETNAVNFEGYQTAISTKLDVNEAAITQWLEGHQAQIAQRLQDTDSATAQRLERLRVNITKDSQDSEAATSQALQDISARISHDFQETQMAVGRGLEGTKEHITQSFHTSQTATAQGFKDVTAHISHGFQETQSTINQGLKNIKEHTSQVCHTSHTATAQGFKDVTAHISQGFQKNEAAINRGLAGIRESIENRFSGLSLQDNEGLAVKARRNAAPVPVPETTAVRNITPLTKQIVGLSAQMVPNVPYPPNPKSVEPEASKKVKRTLYDGYSGIIPLLDNATFIISDEDVDSVITLFVSMMKRGTAGKNLLGFVEGHETTNYRAGEFICIGALTGGGEYKPVNAVGGCHWCKSQFYPMCLSARKDESGKIVVTFAYH